MADDVNVENVENVTIKGVAPASVTMPDHVVRHSLPYQLFERLWRPTLGWVACPIAVTYACVIAPAMGQPLSEGYLVQVLTFATLVAGLKSFEKVKGVA